MRNRRISTDKLKAIRNYLPQGSNKIISEKTGLTPIYVSKVLNGVHQNIPVIEEALKLALEEKAIRDTFDSKLDTLLNKD